MFPGISAAAPILAILGIAVGLQVIKLRLKVFGKAEWIYYAETLALITEQARLRQLAIRESMV